LHAIIKVPKKHDALAMRVFLAITGRLP
jgi:hypothetical protein